MSGHASLSLRREKSLAVGREGGDPRTRVSRRHAATSGPGPFLAPAVAHATRTPHADLLDHLADKLLDADHATATFGVGAQRDVSILRLAPTDDCHVRDLCDLRLGLPPLRLLRLRLLLRFPLRLRVPVLPRSSKCASFSTSARSGITAYAMLLGWSGTAFKPDRVLGSMRGGM